MSSFGIFYFFAASLTESYKLNSLALYCETGCTRDVTVNIHFIVEPHVVNRPAHSAYRVVVWVVGDIVSVLTVGHRNPKEHSVIRHRSEHTEHRCTSDLRSGLLKLTVHRCRGFVTSEGDERIENDLLLGGIATLGSCVFHCLPPFLMRLNLDYVYIIS